MKGGREMHEVVAFDYSFDEHICLESVGGFTSVTTFCRDVDEMTNTDGMIAPLGRREICFRK